MERFAKEGVLSYHPLPSVHTEGVDFFSEPR